MLSGCFLGLWLGMPIPAVSQTGTELSGDPFKGRDAFVYKGCIRCHGAWGKGKKIGPDLAEVGMGKSFYQIAGALWNHAPRMAGIMAQQGMERPRLTGEEIRDLISYLYYLNYFNEPGDPALGMKVFSEEGCMNCHSVRGVGGREGPRLDTYRQFGLSTFMSQAMWNHGPQMWSEMIQQGIRTPSFEGTEMADLLAFIRGRSVAGLSGAASGPRFPGDLAGGKRLFRVKGCATCHPVEGTRAGTGPNLGRTWNRPSVARIAGLMWNHGPAMWEKMQELGIPRPTFRESEMVEIITYLYSLGYEDAPGNPRAGRQVFQNKNCGTCHASRQDSKSSAPDLARSSAAKSPLELIAAMWNHGGVMAEEMEQKGLPWPQFEKNEMRDLAAYVRTGPRP